MKGKAGVVDDDAMLLGSMTFSLSKPATDIVGIVTGASFWALIAIKSADPFPREAAFDQCQSSTRPSRACWHDEREAKAMIYNTIMAQLDIDMPAAPRLTFAWNLAQRFESDLIAFCAAEPHLLLPGDVDGTPSTNAVEQQVTDIEERLEALKSEFDNLVQDNNRASWRGIVGDPTRYLALHARSADLLIAGSGNSGVGRLRTVDPGELILSAGRPVLFSADGQRPVKGESILVAWKDTREARRAIVDAMPFLTDARQVVVATIEEDDRAGARDSAVDVVRFLMKHGVKARSEVMDVGRGYASEALAEIATEVGADLMVSGGYGHNRLREWIFGGVTRSLLKDASTNRFMSN